MLYLGRIHPKKNLAALIDGWAQAELPPGARLAIAGWGEPQHVAALERRLASAPPLVAFLGPAHGRHKQRLIASARFMILPAQRTLPMAMLESWAAGTPTIMTPACHPPEGVEAGAALRCGTDPPSIAGAQDVGADRRRLGPADRFIGGGRRRADRCPAWAGRRPAPARGSQRACAESSRSRQSPCVATGRRPRSPSPAGAALSRANPPPPPSRKPMPRNEGDNRRANAQQESP
ncbi:MAG: glycosyltransferase [Porphyrobacter sp.]|nr:glycosyltransferase [Porphyrobacter sp.]